MCVHGMRLLGPEGGVRFLGAGCTEVMNHPMWVPIWGLNLGPLYEQCDD